MQLKTGNKVQITKVNVKHLKKYEGQNGTIIGWICKGGIFRYKVKFQDETTAYFRNNEMEVM